MGKTITVGQISVLSKVMLLSNVHVCSALSWSSDSNLPLIADFIKHPTVHTYKACIMSIMTALWVESISGSESPCIRAK